MVSLTCGKTNIDLLDVQWLFKIPAIAQHWVLIWIAVPRKNRLVVGNIYTSEKRLGLSSPTLVENVSKQ